MSIARSLLIFGAVAAAGTVLAACETVPSGPSGMAGPAAFRTDDFNWSTGSGRASIEGRVDYRRDGQAFSCTGSVALTPDTPYTRARFRTLYGSTERAAVPAAVVRARDIPDPNANYRSYVRSTACTNGRFSFSGLPDGGWFVIAPVSAGGEAPLVLMRHVDTRAGRAANITL